MLVINGLGTWEGLTAFKKSDVIGSRVIDERAFTEALKTAIAEFDWTKCEAPGQAKIKLPASAHATVSCGEAPVAGLEDGDLVSKVYRGVPTVFAPRSKAAEVKCLEVLVYTRDAFNTDPDDPANAPESVDHVIVAILASPTEDGASYSPTRLAHNLAGGNKAFQVGEGKGGTAEQVLQRAQDEAKKAIGYAKAWLVVYG